MLKTPAYSAKVEPELPPLRTSHLDRARPTLSRKRTIDSVFYSNSSDPPLFSSDDASASIDDYARPRPKRLHTGSWWSSSWQAAPPSQFTPGPKQREFKRNYDSGVWMGSDTSENDLEVSGDTETIGGTLNHAETTIPAELNALNKARRPVQSLALTPQQKEASAIVQQCVESGQESVDLSRLDIKNHLWSVLGPIKHITREPPSSGEFASFEPKLRLYLAQNNLVEIPSEVYTLENLNTLSLRCNNLSRILPAISRLTRLEELNLSSNALHYLPFEILELTDRNLRSLRLLPNPFYVPAMEKQCIADDPFLKGLPGVKECKAVSRVAYYDIRGNLVGGTAPSSSTSSELPERGRRKPFEAADEYERSLSAAPSLYELSIRLCSLYPNPDQLSTCLPEGAPQYMQDALERMAQVKTEGGSRCTVCGKDFIIPRTEWIEWWTGLPNVQSFGIPLLRRGCSWRCLPDVGHVQQNAMACGWKMPTDAENF